jgi:hypothetical protein
MIDSLKTWAIEIGLKKLGPSAIRAAILGIASWLIARDGLLTSYGIVSDAAARTTTIHWDAVSSALIVGLPAVIAVIVKLTQHTTTAAVTGAPQNGDPMQQERRATDPPKP